MKLDLTPEQLAELQPVLSAIDGGKVCVGQIRRSPYPNEDAGAFVLVYTLVSQPTARRIRAAIERGGSTVAGQTPRNRVHRPSGGASDGMAGAVP